MQESGASAGRALAPRAQPAGRRGALAEASSDGGGDAEYDTRSNPAAPSSAPSSAPPEEPMGSAPDTSSAAGWASAARRRAGRGGGPTAPPASEVQKRVEKSPKNETSKFKTISTRTLNKEDNSLTDSKLNALKNVKNGKVKTKITSHTVLRKIVKSYSQPMDPEANRAGPLRALYPGGFDDASAAAAARCAAGAPPLVVALVFSAPGRSAARAAVRGSWARGAGWLAAAFVVGRAGDAATEAALRREQRRHGDLLRPAFQDTHRNLTLKTMAMLEWFTQHCPKSSMLLKVDDDVALSARRLRAFALRQRAAGARCALWGQVMGAREPFRDPRNKYYTSPAQWSARRFPPFAAGPAYALGEGAPAALLRRALQEDDPLGFLPVEDVFLSGVVAPAANVSVLSAPLWMPEAYHTRQLLRHAFGAKPLGASPRAQRCLNIPHVAIHPVPPQIMATIINMMAGVCPK